MCEDHTFSSKANYNVLDVDSVELFDDFSVLKSLFFDDFRAEQA